VILLLTAFFACAGTAYADAMLKVVCWNQKSYGKYDQNADHSDNAFCNATAISMVANYYGGSYSTLAASIDKLIAARLVRTDGWVNALSTSGGLVLRNDLGGTVKWDEYVSSPSLTSIKTHLDAGQLAIGQQYPYPNHLRHFYVIVGYKGDTLFINDPWGNGVELAGSGPIPNTYHLDGADFFSRTPQSPSPSPNPTGSAATSLVLDVSDTMSNMFQGQVKLDEAKSAARDLVSVIQNGGNLSGLAGQIAVASFATDAHKLQALTTDYASVLNAINGLQTDDMTNLAAGIDAGTDELAAAAAGAPKVMILLTDGQANQGIYDPDQIIAGPVTRAHNEGIKIYTIGFGEPGDLNEPLLQRIAQATGGQYRLADSSAVATSLASVFIRAQVAATQKVLGEFQGTVSQGQTAVAGQFVVPQASGNLQTILMWPGSTLQVQLTDPAGVNVATGYPGYKVSGSTRPQQTIVVNPKPGSWTASVYGQQVSQTQEPFYSIASFKKTAASPTPVTAMGGGAGGSGAGVVIVIVMLIAGGLIVWVVVDSRRGGRSRSEAEIALADDWGRRYTLHSGVNTVGRGEGNDILLDSTSVSRRHAALVLTSGSLEVHDLGSTFGTSVNGARVTSANVTDGDSIAFGDQKLRLQYPGREN
jgi:hypothetical protein